MSKKSLISGAYMTLGMNKLESNHLQVLKVIYDLCKIEKHKAVKKRDIIDYLDGLPTITLIEMGIDPKEQEKEKKFRYKNHFQRLTEKGYASSFREKQIPSHSYYSMTKLGIEFIETFSTHFNKKSN